MSMPKPQMQGQLIAGRGHSSGYPGSKDRKTTFPLPTPQTLTYALTHIHTALTVALLMAKTCFAPIFFV